MIVADSFATLDGRFALASIDLPAILRSDVEGICHVIEDALDGAPEKFWPEIETLQDIDGLRVLANVVVDHSVESRPPRVSIDHILKTI